MTALQQRQNHCSTDKATGHITCVNQRKGTLMYDDVLLGCVAESTSWQDIHAASIKKAVSRRSITMT